MKRKLIAILLCLTVVFVEAFALTACGKKGNGGDDKPTACTHQLSSPIRENEVAATCVSEGSFDEVVYCLKCGDKVSTTHKTIGKLPHTFNGTPKVIETLIDGCAWERSVSVGCTGEGCTAVDTTTETIYKHSYSFVDFETIATCSHEGAKRYECACGDAITVPYEDKDNHVWDDGEKNGSVTVYTCECGLTKTVIDAKEEITATVSTEDLFTAGTVELKEASLSFDAETLNALGEDVEITAETVDKGSLSLEQEIFDKIGDATVFDFSLKSNDQTVSEFDGKVKIRIPYELKPGEDPEHIAVWYLGASGEVESFQAKYFATANGGEVEFETPHFSSYVVVKLSKEEVCELYGHQMKLISSKVATCCSEGLELFRCSCCGHEESIVSMMTEHEFIITEVVSPTATKDGYVIKTCGDCGSVIRTNLAKKESVSSDKVSNFISSLAGDLTLDLDVNGMIKVYGSIFEDDGKRIIYADENLAEETFVGIVIDGKAYSIQGGELYISEAEGSMELFSMLNSVPYLLEGLPKVAKDVIAKVGDVLVSNLFTVEENGQGDLLTLDFDRVLALNGQVSKLPIKDLIDELCGKDTYSNLLKTAENICNSKLGDIEELYDLDLEAIVDVVAPFLDGLAEGFDAETIKQMIAGLSDFTVADIISLVTESTFKFSEIKAQIEEYASLTVYDLILGSSDEDMGDLIKMMVSQLIEELSKGISLQMQLDDEGRILEINLSAELPSELFGEGFPFGDVLDITATVKAEKTDRDYKSILDMMNNVADKFVLDENNYEWAFKNIIDEYPGITFTLQEIENEYGNSYSAFVSSDVTYVTEDESFDGHFVIAANLSTAIEFNEDFDGWYSYSFERHHNIEFITNEYGHYVPHDELRQLLGGAYFVNVKTGETFYTDCSNYHFSFSNAHDYQVKYLSYENYVKKYGETTSHSSSAVGIVGYELVCKNCGKVEHGTRWLYDYEDVADVSYNYLPATSRLSKEVIEGALDVSVFISKDGKLAIGNVTFYDGTWITEFESSKTFYVGEYTYVLTVSKVGTCRTDYKLTVKKSNQAIKEFNVSRYSHVCFDENDYYVYLDACHRAVYSICEKCGAHVLSYIESTHDFYAYDGIDPTVTKPGIKTLRCSRCGEENVSVGYCQHNHMKNGVCPDCGASFNSTTLLLFERLPEFDDETGIAFGFRRPYGYVWDSWEFAMNDCSITLMYGDDTGDEPELETVAYGQLSEEHIEFDGWGTGVCVVRFDVEGFEPQGDYLVANPMIVVVYEDGEDMVVQRWVTPIY